MFHIVLVEPEIPQNAGNIARTCAATGTHLHMIRPLGFEVSDKYLKRAGLDYWHLVDISYYDSFQELKDKGYLVLKDDSKQGKNHFVFYDKSMLAEQEEETIIEIPAETVEKQNNIRKQIDNCGKDNFVF